MLELNNTKKVLDKTKAKYETEKEVMEYVDNCLKVSDSTWLDGYKKIIPHRWKDTQKILYYINIV